MSTSTANSKLVAFGWPLLCAAVATGYVEWRTQRIDDELAARPPVAILPVDESTLRIIEENPGIKAEDALTRVRNAGRRLADAGFVVLNTTQVYGYPVDIEARP